MADHPPAARRAVLRALKGGTHPAGLIEDAREISDPGHAAGALLAIAADARLHAPKVADLIEESRRLLRKVERPGRMAEAWGEALATAMPIRRGPGVEVAKDGLQDAAIKAIMNMPNGSWTSDAIIALAPHLEGNRHQRLLRRALTNTGHEVEAAKAVLAVEPGLVNVVRDHAPPAVASRLLGHLAHHDEAGISEALDAAWAIEDDAERREALRVIVWRLDGESDLARVAATCRGRDDADRAFVLTSIGGRADRLGLDSASHFGAAADAASRVEGKPGDKLRRKLQQAMERAGMDAPVPEEAAEPSQDPAEEPAEPAERQPKVIPVVPGPRNVLAIVDGYSGGLGAPHVRAVARAAPLCVAFGLDLAIVGFPPVDADGLVRLVEAETNVGEGEGYVAKLHSEGRLHVMALEHGVPAQWPGHPLATTPHPAEGKHATMEDTPTPVCLLVGLGKSGIPHKLLAAVKRHHELTGQGISLETATAMGILADRLGRLSV